MTDARTAAPAMMLVRLTPRQLPRLANWSTSSLQLALFTPSERAMSPDENRAHTASSPRHDRISMTFVTVRACTHTRDAARVHARS